MALKFEIEQWQAACEAFDNGDYELALQSFTALSDSAKMHFNIGLIFTAVEDHDRALAAYTKAITMDPYFAVAYFQRGVSHFVKNDMEAAIYDFDQAYQKLRGNQIINYNQLGLAFRLYECEVLFNRGVAFLYTSRVDAGLSDLYQAQKSKMTEEHNVIDQAVKDRGRNCSVFSIPPFVIFRPPENRLRQLQGIDMLANMDQRKIIQQMPAINPIQRNNSVMLKYTQPVIRPRHDSMVNLYQSNEYHRVDSGFESAYSQQTIPIQDEQVYGDFDRELDEIYGSFHEPELKLKIKAHYTDTRIMIVSNKISFEELKLKVMEKFNIQTPIRIQYKDEDQERVLMIDDEDLYMARQANNKTPSDFEKLELWCI